MEWKKGKITSNIEHKIQQRLEHEQEEDTFGNRIGIFEIISKARIIILITNSTFIIIISSSSISSERYRVVRERRDVISERFGDRTSHGRRIITRIRRRRWFPAASRRRSAAGKRFRQRV